ncbi:MAG: hypothetical protein JXA28_06730, partial [Bacteroidetes bacterium]|nr:hypothetical protein [Bacteroidota bacterium]
MLKTITLSTQIFLMTISSTYAQEDFQTTVAAREAREVVAEIRGGYGTFYLKRSSGEDLFTLREKRDPENARQDVAVDYTVDNGIGHLTVELGKTD